MSLVLQDQLVLSPATADHLQEEIDTIEAASDVADVVGNYEELEDYDTSALTDKDVIKVLDDETHDHAQTYWRYSKSGDSFTYIGQIAKPAVDSVNGKTGDVVLNATDVSALPITGGTMTGSIDMASNNIKFGENNASGGAGIEFVNNTGLVVGYRMNAGSGISPLWRFVPGTGEFGPTSNKTWTIGSSNYEVRNIYTTKLNNGGDIEVPTSSGTMALISDVDTKVSKTSTASQVYGTDANGAQTTYNKDDFGQVDDIKINNTSIVNNKIANITIDNALNTSSTNAVQNGVVATAINNKSGVVFKTWSD